MKLIFAKFARQVDVPGIGAVAELHANVRSLEYDRVNDTVWIGDDGTGVPWGQVVQHKRDRSADKDLAMVKKQCELCQRKFNNAQALGAHQRHSHGVRGKSRGDTA